LIDGIRGQITTTKRIGKKIQEDGFAFAFSVGKPKCFNSNRFGWDFL